MKQTEDRQNTEENKKKEQPLDWKKEVLEYVKMIVIAVAIVAVLELFIIVNAVIPSASMEPTIMTGDRIFGWRLAYVTEEIERFDIVIFRYPDDKRTLFIKRVIGLPGDVIDIHGGEVYVNGSETPLEDTFCSVQDQTEEGYLTYPLTVPEGCYFMLGDNRTNSRDSRYWQNTFVEKDDILGKAVFRYWPLSRISVIRED